MKKIAGLFALLALLAVEGSTVTVYRKGKDFWVQSRFSKTQDIVINIFRDVNERSYLVPVNSDLRTYAEQQEKLLKSRKLTYLHNSADEYPATYLGYYGYLSGNHGSSSARKVTAPDHGFTNADSGKTITDEKNRKYVFIRVLNKDTFIMHPEQHSAKSPIGRAYFPGHAKEKLFFNGKEIKFKSSRMTQLRPMNMVTRSEFLVDGKTPLPEGKVVKCRFIEHVFDHGVLAPEAVIRFIQEKKSAKVAEFVTDQFYMYYVQDGTAPKGYAELPRIMNVKNRMRYQPNGALVSYRTCDFPVSMVLINQLEMMFGWSGPIAYMPYKYFYIPKTKPVAFQNAKNKKTKELITYDFAKGVNISKGLPINGYLYPKDALDPNNQPDRFIRLTGRKGPQYGVVVGYSLIYGSTAIANPEKNRPYSYYFYPSMKVYPMAYKFRNNKAGLSMSTVAYKQYFAPEEEPDAFAFYYHKQNNSDIVYFDTVKTLKNKVLLLPPEMKGKKISVIEKSPSVTLHTTGVVPEGGVKISVSGGPSYIVLKLD